MSSELLEIQPRELKFIFELKKQSTCIVRLVNKTNSLVAFKVKTTSPKKYCVRPNVGIIKPKSTCDFVVTMQALRVAPPDLICKDKFLVQSTIVPEGTTDDGIVSGMFSKDEGRYVEENKLKVVLVSPPHSPVLSPINGTHKLMEDHEPPMLNDQVFNGIQFMKPQKKSTEEITLSKNDGIEEATLPSKKSNGDISPRSSGTSDNITFPDNASSKDVSLQKNESNEHHNLTNNHSIEDMILQKNEAVEDIIPPVKETNEDFNVHKNESFKFISPQKHEIVEDFSLENNQTIEDTSLLNNIDGGFKNQEKKVVKEDAKESKIGSGEEFVGAGSVDVGKMNGNKELELVKDIHKMTSKLTELEFKLSQSEKMISKLTEERRLSTLERESLRKEVAMLKSRSGMRRVQVGFPLLFVVMVALVSIVVGYLSHC